MQERIKWNIINAALAGMLVFLGSAVDGTITLKGVCVAFVAGLVVAITKFKEFWATLENKREIFNFL